MSKKYAALSFDDGHSNVTSKVLDILENNKVPGTFFIIGEHIGDEFNSRELFKRQLSLGCEIGNHALTHSHMSELTAEQIRNEISTTTDLIREYAGVEPTLFRPPYLDVNDVMFDNIDLTFICGADPHDWDGSVSVEQRIANVMELVKDGTVILLHDFTDNVKTLEALPIIIEKLREQDYELVTISKLFEVTGADPKKPNTCWSYLK